MRETRVGIHLREFLVLSLPLLRVLDSEPFREYLSDSFQRHALDFGEAEDDEYPSDGADAAVESERAARCYAPHHGQERRCDDDVGAPTCDRVLKDY